jgi:hypothetical protein
LETGRNVQEEEGCRQGERERGMQVTREKGRGKKIYVDREMHGGRRGKQER